MRVMARVSIPVESGNSGIRDGSLPKVMQQTAEKWKPEAMYFTTFEGRRTAYIVFDLPDSSQISSGCSRFCILPRRWFTVPVPSAARYVIMLPARCFSCNGIIIAK